MAPPDPVVDPVPDPEPRPPADWHNLPFWLMLIGLFLSQIQTVGVVNNASTLGKWVLVVSGFVTALQYALARGKIRGTS